MNQRTHTLLWCIGLGSAPLFCVPQAWQALYSVAGISIAQIGGAIFFLVCQLMLAHADHPSHRSTAESRVIQVYWAWLAGVMLMFAAVAHNPTYTWSGFDTAIVVTICAGSVLVLALGTTLDFGVRDPQAQAGFGIVFKSLPQLVLALKIAHEGGAGFTRMGVVVGHVIILSRIYQIALIAREQGWVRNRRLLFASELANETTWLAATVVWIAV